MEVGSGRPLAAVVRWEYARRLLTEEYPFVLYVSPHREGHLAREPAFPWFTQDGSRPWRGYWTVRAAIPGLLGYVALAEVVDTSVSYPEPQEYQYHIHIPPSPSLPAGRNVHFCKDWGAVAYGQLYHAHDYHEIGPQPRSRGAHLDYLGVCLRWALATATTLLEVPELPFADRLTLNEMSALCPDDYS